MSKPVDIELKKAFIELQLKMMETSNKIKVIDSQLAVIKRMSQHIDMTQSKIFFLPPETTTYEAVGRMFLHTDLPKVKKNLYIRGLELAERLCELENNKQCLEENLKESEENIREMVQQRKDQTEKSP